MSRNDRARLRRRSIGYVFQDFNLLAGLTAARTSSLPLELDGIGARRARGRRARRARASSASPSRAERFPDELSGGERQRVAIARAVVGDRHLLLADEPTGALDSVNGEAVMRLLRAACKRGVAGVVVTHDAQLASWADRVVFLRDGRVVDQTAPPPGPESLLAPSSTIVSRRRQNGGGCRPGARSPGGHGGCSGASGVSRHWCSCCSPSSVAAAVFGASAAYNVAPSRDAEFGSADQRIVLRVSDPKTLQADLTALEASFGAIDVIGHQEVAGTRVRRNARSSDARSTRPLRRPHAGLETGPLSHGGRRGRPHRWRGAVAEHSCRRVAQPRARGSNGGRAGREPGQVERRVRPSGAFARCSAPVGDRPVVRLAGLIEGQTSERCQLLRPGARAGREGHRRRPRACAFDVGPASHLPCRGGRLRGHRAAPASPTRHARGDRRDRRDIFASWC